MRKLIYGNILNEMFFCSTHIFNFFLTFQVCWNVGIWSSRCQFSAWDLKYHNIWHSFNFLQTLFQPFWENCLFYWTQKDDKTLNNNRIFQIDFYSKNFKKQIIKLNSSFKAYTGKWNQCVNSSLYKPLINVRLDFLHLNNKTKMPAIVF